MQAMADNISIPAPPRTPTPPEDSYPEISGLGLDGMQELGSPMKALFDPNALSPMSENFPFSRYSSSTHLGPAVYPLNSTSNNSLYSPVCINSAGGQTGGSQENGKAPFNFKSMSLAKSPITKSVRRALHASQYM